MGKLVMVELDQRAVVRIGGADRVTFLQNLVSGDVAKVETGRTVWSALLTPQGKYLFDFFLYPAAGDAILLDVEKARAADLVRRLTLYRLRAKVAMEDVSLDHRIFAIVGEGAAGAVGLWTKPGPPWPSMRGFSLSRSSLPNRRTTRCIGRTFASRHSRGFLVDWDRLRLSLSVPDGSRDLIRGEDHPPGSRL